MVHGLETLKRLNQEAVDLHQSKEKPDTQDVRPEAILSLVVQNKEAWQESWRVLMGAKFYQGGYLALQKLEEQLRERMDANSKAKG